MTLRDLPIGSVVLDPESTMFSEAIRWLVVDKNHAGYPPESVTLVTQYLPCALSFDAVEPLSSDDDHNFAGNQNYELSNIRQWLNSEQTYWYTPQHAVDMPPADKNLVVSDNPYENWPGFLHGFSKGFRKALLPTDVIYARPPREGGGLATLADKMFLLSVTEMTLTGINSEGAPIAYFADVERRKAYPSASCAANNHASSGIKPNAVHRYWLRSYRKEYASLVYIMHSTGALNMYDAYNGVQGIRAACNLSGATAVEALGDGASRLVFPPDAPPVWAYRGGWQRAKGVMAFSEGGWKGANTVFVNQK